MTQVFSFFRFRRWTQEQKSNSFKAALQILFGVFCTLAIFAIWQVSGKSTALGIALGALLLVAVIVFDITMRAAMYLSKAHSNQYTSYRQEIDQVRQELRAAQLKADMYETQSVENTRTLDAVTDKFNHLKQLMFKKRKGKTPRVSRAVKKSLSSIEDLL